MRRVILGGITGKVGKAAAKRIYTSPEFELVAAVGKNSAGQDIGEILGLEKSGRRVYSSVAQALEHHQADVYVDFTTPEASKANLLEANAAGLALIVGTTGLEEEFVQDLSEKVKQAGGFALFASNFSFGIVILAQAARMLGSYYGADEVQIVETHHRSKIDMPSGTSLYLRKLLAVANPDDVRIESIRGNERVSRHQIVVRTGTESILIDHNVANPEAFAAGVHYVLQHASGKTGVYHDLTSFIQELERQKVGGPTCCPER